VDESEKPEEDNELGEDDGISQEAPTTFPDDTS